MKLIHNNVHRNVTVASWHFFFFLLQVVILNNAMRRCLRNTKQLKQMNKLEIRLLNRVVEVRFVCNHLLQNQQIK